MKVSTDWLKNYVEFDGSPSELVETLPMLGLEVEESTEDSKNLLDNVVVGEILHTEPHPEAERLNVCSVQVSTSQEPANIVCGATNFKTGDRVPVALPGAKLPGGFKIKKSKLRGVHSEGMMCSAKELNLGDDDKGLLILPESSQVGTQITDLFQGDSILELEITANRGDCLSHIGVAREIAAYYDKKLILPEVHIELPDCEKPSDQNLISTLSVESNNCPYYTICAIKGVKIAPSPDWLAQRLEAVGLRSINNVVDITNFVLLETGQPLHAFDANKIEGKSIRVRQALNGEKMTTLDDVERTLDPEMLVIADQEKPLVIAGIMGSLDAEVDKSTVDIILESAYFNPSNVRSTARRLGLHSDSSQRFSRDVDPAGVKFSACRAIDLILEVAGGSVVPEIVSFGTPPRGSRNVEIEKSFVENRCGFKIDSEQLARSWKRLGFDVRGSDPWQVTIPSFRSEVERPIDLVEEFIRIFGTKEVNNVPLVLPAIHRDNDQTFDFCEQCIDNLSGQGFQEVCNYSLRSAEEINSWFPHFDTNSISLDNPLTADHTHIRPSLLPGLLDSLATNQKNLNLLSQVFETGRVFQPGPRGNVELISVAIALLPNTNTREWKKSETLDFYDIKRVIHRLFHSVGVNLPKKPWTHLEETAPWQRNFSTVKGNVHQNKIQISAGVISLSLSKQKEIKGPVLGAEVLIDPVLFSKKKNPYTFKPFSSFPPAIKDLAFVVNADCPAEDVRKALESIAQKVVAGSFFVDPICIFDLFYGKGLPENTKSVACSMKFRSPERTLGENEVNDAFEKIVKKIEEETPYKLRT